MVDYYCTKGGELGFEVVSQRKLFRVINVVNRIENFLMGFYNVCFHKRTHKHTRAFILLQKRTESDRIVIGGMNDENDTQKGNAYN